MSQHYRLVALAFVLICIQACSTTRTGPVPVENRSRQATVEDIGTAGDNAGQTPRPAAELNRTQPGVRAPAPTTPPVIVALLENAEVETGTGNYEGAAATLERAVRIDPKNALVWHRLARLRMRQGNWQQALNLARKSNSLAGGDQLLQRENWQLILEVKQKVGDEQGVESARRMLEQLRRAGADVRS